MNLALIADQKSGVNVLKSTSRLKRLNTGFRGSRNSTRGQERHDPLDDDEDAGRQPEKRKQDLHCHRANFPPVGRKIDHSNRLVHHGDAKDENR